MVSAMIDRAKRRRPLSACGEDVQGGATTDGVQKGDDVERVCGGECGCDCSTTTAHWQLNRRPMRRMSSQPVLSTQIRSGKNGSHRCYA